MEKKKRFTFGKGLMLLGLILILGAAGLYGYNQWIDYQAGQQSEAAVITLVDEIQNQEVAIVEVEDQGPSEELLKVAQSIVCND